MQEVSANNQLLVKSANRLADDPPPPTGRLVGASEAERMTGLSRQTLRRLAERGELRAWRAGDAGPVRYDRLDLEKIWRPVAR
jgi:excisionase family DNA binding protein